MSSGHRWGYDHAGEEILDECPRCRLPIYQSDSRRLLALPSGGLQRLYHSGCGMAAEGEYLELQLQADAQLLRGCGYVVDVKLVRPVR